MSHGILKNYPKCTLIGGHKFPAMLMDWRSFLMQKGSDVSEVSKVLLKEINERHFQQIYKADST